MLLLLLTGGGDIVVGWPGRPDCSAISHARSAVTRVVSPAGLSESYIHKLLVHPPYRRLSACPTKSSGFMSLSSLIAGGMHFDLIFLFFHLSPSFSPFSFLSM